VRRVKAQRILLVDDDIETVETLSRYLHLSGLNNSTCYGGLAALSVLSRSSFDVIVLDLRLGDLDGLEVLRRLRSRGLATPVIIVTGFATIRSAVEATKLGADLCEKPVDADDLLTALKRLAETHDIIHRDGQASALIRWADAVTEAMMSLDDLQTVETWAQQLGISAAALRGWCRTAGFTPKTSLSFARLIRAYHLAFVQGYPPERFINAADPRTVGRLLSKRLPAATSDGAEIRTLLWQQSIITDDRALRSVQDSLRRRASGI